MSYKNNISLNIVVLDEWGDLLEDLDASTFPSVFVAPEVGSNITDTITDLSDLDDNHTPWGIYERGNGIYRLDLPDLSAGNYKVYGFSAGASIVPQKITVDLETGITTLLERVTGLIRTKSEDEVVDTTILDALDNIDVDLTPITDSLTGIESNITTIKQKTDSMTFTVAGFLDTNVYRWRGTQPGTLDSNGFVPSNIAAINGNTAAVATFRTALDNNYFEKLNVSGTLAHTDNADLFKADVSNIEVVLDEETQIKINQIYNSVYNSPNQIISVIGENLYLIQGDDYLEEDSRNIVFTSVQWINLSDATVVFGVYGTNILKELGVVTVDDLQQLSLELTKEETSIPQGSYKYDVQATLSNGSVVTLFRGNLEVVKSYTN